MVKRQRRSSHRATLHTRVPHMKRAQTYKGQFILWQVPHPEMQRFEVAADEHQRVVLASDGVWDFVTEVQTQPLALTNTPTLFLTLVPTHPQA